MKHAWQFGNTYYTYIIIDIYSIGLIYKPFIKKILFGKLQMIFIMLCIVIDYVWLICKHYLDWHHKVATDVHVQLLQVLNKCFLSLSLSVNSQIPINYGFTIY